MKYGMKKILDIEMKNQFRYLLQEFYMFNLLFEYRNIS